MYCSESVCNKLIELEFYRTSLWTLFCICKLIVCLIVEEREIVIISRPHSEICLESYPFVFYIIIHLLPINTLWFYFIRRYIKKSATQITGRITTSIKCIPQLKCNLNLNHRIYNTLISEICTSWNYKSVIRLVILIILEPIREICIPEHP